MEFAFIFDANKHRFSLQKLDLCTDSSTDFITGPPTHSDSVVGQTSNGHWHLSSVVVCNTRIYNVTHQGAARDGGPVVLPNGPVLFCSMVSVCVVCRRL